MENYICINGKKAELTEEQMKALGIELPKKPSPFDRVRENQSFYYIGSDGNVGVTRECYNGFDTSCYRYGNYCTDREIMKQRAFHETLNRLLWRYSMEHHGDALDWRIACKNKYYIYYSYQDNKFMINYANTYKDIGVAYFYNHEIAEAAIKEIIEPFMKAHPDFKW